jgi:hypothetical protein
MGSHMVTHLVGPRHGGQTDAKGYRFLDSVQARDRADKQYGSFSPFPQARRLGDANPNARAAGAL